MAENELLLEDISLHPLIRKMIDDLSFNQIFHERLGVAKIQIAKQDIRKAIWLTSILSTSEKDEHRNLSQVLASLLYLQNTEDNDIGRACYVLFSRLGNLTGANLLTSQTSNYAQVSMGTLGDFDAYDASLLLELQLEKTAKTIQSANEEITTTGFQRTLWEQIGNENKVVVSAPTSSGKSFIIKKFLKTQIADTESYTAVYVVPSRALLNQVSEDLRNEVDIEHVTIKTVFNFDEDADETHRIFILTPERCLRLLKYRWEKDLKIDMIFIDEVQNVEDTQGRGALSEFVFKEFYKLFPAAKIIAAGPNIEDAGILFDHVFGTKGKTVETTVSPVFQIKTTVIPKSDNRLEFTISSNNRTTQSLTIKTDIDHQKNFNTNTGEGLKHLISLCGKGQQNIIYSPKGNWAADWALKFAATIDDNVKTDPFLQEIIEFLAEEIHPRYYLIPCLSKGVAYHHGNLPDIVRKEIEDGFLDGKIRNLFCTSTLLQGVNLPANNLFIPMPKKRHMALTPFDFGNLVGRAGRIRDSLYGTIFCIERKEEDLWSQEMYAKSFKKKVQTASSKSLDRLDDFINELEKKVDDITNEADRSAVVFFRQKYAQSPDELQEYLNRNNLSEGDIQKVETLLKTSLENLSIPHEVLRQNPTIDPLLQSELYEQIKALGVEKWLIASSDENPNLYKYQTEAEKQKLPFESWSFYWQLNDLISRLDEIFHITNEAYFKHSVSISVRQICFHARKWLNGISLRRLIEGDIRFHSNHTNAGKKIDPDNDDQVNDRINNVIKVNSVITTHLLIKYIKLLNDLAEPFLTDELKERYRLSFALPSMLELGTREESVISLISRGVSRSIALKIFNEFRKIEGYENLDIIRWLASKEELNLKPIYNRYLKRMKLLKSVYVANRQ
ncbi:DEAD/DEAH box helicase [Mucilaginibacter sp. PAMB04274]|uniref:DEAD/DEAH box helicase n=1 Tax=Mucilaginibacter sp. PAMB04274 TaxID=3138568 RepID=UPI0031F6291E